MALQDELLEFSVGVDGIRVNGCIGGSKCSFASLGILLLLGFKCSLVL